jgi:CTP synthase
MRLGAYALCDIKKGSKAFAMAYGKQHISERHRHRYEFNNKYLASNDEDAGMIASGINPDSNLVEIVELKNHPFFIGCTISSRIKINSCESAPTFC